MHPTDSSTAAAASFPPLPQGRGGRRAGPKRAAKPAPVTEPALPFTVKAHHHSGVLFELEVVKGVKVSCRFELATAAALADALEQVAGEVLALHADKQDSQGISRTGTYGRLWGWSGCFLFGATLIPPRVNLDNCLFSRLQDSWQDMAALRVELDMSPAQALDTARRVRIAVLESQAIHYSLREALPDNAGKALDADPGDEHRASAEVAA